MSVIEDHRKVIFHAEDREWMTEIITEWRDRGLNKLADELAVELQNIKDDEING